jgi:RNA polymerase sigma-70 factor (ECF subfamily)
VHAEGGDVQAEIDPVETRRVAERFLAACATGDLEQLLAVLDPEVAGQTDSGGAVPAPRMRIVGRERVAQLLLAWLEGWQVTLVSMPVNTAPGALALVDGQVVAALALTIGNGVITEIHAVANPDKLEYVKSMLAGRLPSPS